MTVFFIILAALVAVGLTLYLHHRITERRENMETTPVPEPAPATDTSGQEVCCGAHAICEKGLPPAKPVYFDDEELDRFAGRPADAYTPAETDEFRDVMLTLLPSDVVPWTQSIEMRGILLPDTLRDELLMLISDTASSPATAS